MSPIHAGAASVPFEGGLEPNPERDSINLTLKKQRIDDSIEAPKLVHVIPAGECLNFSTS